MIDGAHLLGELDLIGATIGPDTLEAPRGSLTAELREAVVHHKQLLRGLYRLRLGQRWLTEQSEAYFAEDSEAAADDLFTRALGEWDRLEREIRDMLGFPGGCIHGPNAVCPPEAPVRCFACSQAPT